jgi:hypothetical protein
MPAQRTANIAAYEHWLARTPITVRTRPMADPLETRPENVDPYGKKTPPQNGVSKLGETQNDKDVGGRSHGLHSRICTQCGAENWIDPSWLVFRCWCCGNKAIPSL